MWYGKVDDGCGRVCDIRGFWGKLESSLSCNDDDDDDDRPRLEYLTTLFRIYPT